ADGGHEGPRAPRGLHRGRGGQLSRSSSDALPKGRYPTGCRPFAVSGPGRAGRRSPREYPGADEPGPPASLVLVPALLDHRQEGHELAGPRLEAQELTGRRVLAERAPQLAAEEREPSVGGDGTDAAPSVRAERRDLDEGTVAPDAHGRPACLEARVRLESRALAELHEHRSVLQPLP